MIASGLSSALVMSSPSHWLQVGFSYAAGKTVLHFEQIFLVVSLSRAISFVMFIRTALYSREFFERSMFRLSACSVDRGMPSNRTLCPGSSLLMKSSTISITTSFWTRFPASMIVLIFLPSSESSFASSRSAPPVSKILRLYCAATVFPTVPFPAPCIPKKIRSIL